MGLVIVQKRRRKLEAAGYHISPYLFLDKVKEKLNNNNLTDEDRIQIDWKSKIYLSLRLLSVNTPDMCYYVTHLIKQLKFINYSSFEKDKEYKKLSRLLITSFNHLMKNK